MPIQFDPQRLLRREQAVSAAINAVLSLLFFSLVFGLAARPLAMGVPDRFALDFLPQGVMVSLMASLVPSLIVRGKLRKEGLRPAAGLGRVVATGVLAGLASALVLLALALLGPVTRVASLPALAFKIGYGAALGFACTRLALTSLIPGMLQEQAA